MMVAIALNAIVICALYFPALEHESWLVLLDHFFLSLFVIEAKEWYGRLTGDDQEWLLNHTPKRCPMWADCSVHPRLAKDPLVANRAPDLIAA